MAFKITKTEAAKTLSNSLIVAATNGGWKQITKENVEAFMSEGMAGYLFTGTGSRKMDADSYLAASFIAYPAVSEVLRLARKNYNAA